MNHALTAVSPIDGRYRSKVEILSDYFSEYALIRYRVRVEIEYFIALCNIPLPQLKGFPRGKFPSLRKIYKDLTVEQAARVKDMTMWRPKERRFLRNLRFCFGMRKKNTITTMINGMAIKASQGFFTSILFMGV